ncbi:hypothetical protein ABC345_11565 [Shouchella sp. 1P09AA]|uniref:hypothetical protein n=1 Tax=unclassified Shouchella TaxID=2893065 RepID=UPI00399FBB64
MDQAHNLRQRSMEHSLQKRKALHLYISNADDACIVEQLIHSLSDYGYEACGISTAAAKSHFRMKFQDRLLHSEQVKQLTTLRIDVLLYIHTWTDSAMLTADLPSLFFISANEDQLLKTYQKIKQRPFLRAYVIGTGNPEERRNQQALENLKDTVKQYMQVDVVDLGWLERSREDFTDGIYETTSLLIQDWLVTV